MANTLITGGAGFIGSHVALALLKKGDEVTILDDFNDFLYSSDLKHARIEYIKEQADSLGISQPTVVAGSILDAVALDKVFAVHEFDSVIHLAAHPNPGFSVDKAEAYTSVNVLGTLNILEKCTAYEVKQLIFAGSSSVYDDRQTPFKEDAYPLRPRSPYGASKAAGEVYCQMWSELYGLPVTVLRFFSVYGPWGRPDMAPYIFAQQVWGDEAISLTSDRKRDFTYIDDIVAGIVLATEKKFAFEIINLGRGEPVELREFIAVLEKTSGKTAKITDRPAPVGELTITYANIDKAKRLLGYEPNVRVVEGAALFMKWLMDQRVS